MPFIVLGQLWIDSSKNIKTVTQESNLTKCSHTYASDKIFFKISDNGRKSHRGVNPCLSQEHYFEGNINIFGQN